MQEIPHKWKPRGKTYEEAMEYIKGRRTGKITSLKTRWNKFNHAGTDGIEFNSTVIIGGRPGALKSAIKDQMIRDFFEYNPTIKFRVLDLQMEMVGRVTALRELSAATGKSYKYLCSAEGEITAADYIKCKDYGQLKGDYDKYPVDVIEESCSIKEFGNIIDQYMEVHSFINENNEKEYTKTVIAVDHSILFEDDEIDLNKLLLNLGKLLTSKKRKYPIIFIILSQLNRAVEREERNAERRHGNYILASDFYGSEGLGMHADIQIGLDRPALRNIRIYGPPGFIIDSECDLVLRWIKCRNGENQLSFFKVDFSSMTIYEVDPPPTVKGGIAAKEKDVFVPEKKYSSQTKANL